MKDRNEIRISQCLIVKDEEKNIERALSWGKSVMWEQIVIDTGSTDQTMELARKLGAKVFDLEWPEDFAAAKNYAIDQAQGDWIVFLDADEYMAETDAKKLPDIFAQLSGQDLDGVAAMLYNLDDDGRIFSFCSHLRFFRNSIDIRYRRRIHEQLVSLSGRELRILDGTGELSIFHTGYQGSVSVKKKKSGRNRKMLQKEIEEHPQDPELLGYMGDECLDDGELKEAEQCYRTAIEYMPGELKEYDQRNAATFTKLLMVLTEKEDTDPNEIRKVYGQAVRAFPKEGDLDYMAGRFFAAHGQPMDGMMYLENALDKLERHGCTNRALFLAGNLGDAYDLLAKCCYETGELQKCVQYAVEHLKYERYEMKPLFWLLKALFHGRMTASGKIDEDENAAVKAFFTKLYDLSSLKDRLFVIKAAQKAGCDSFAEYMTGCFFSPEERRSLGL